MARLPRGVNAFLLFAAGFTVGVGVYALAGPNAIALPEAVQVVLLAMVTAGIGVGGVVIGSNMSLESARYAANLAHDDAVADREAARGDAAASRDADRDAFLYERKTGLMADVVQRAEQHIQEVRSQVARREEVAAGGGDPDTIPTVGSSDPVGQAAADLYLFADQDTADAAWRVYQRVLAFDQFVYKADVHRIGPRVVGLPPGHDELALLTYDAYVDAKTAFLNTVRNELGLAPLVYRPFVPPTGTIATAPATSAPPVPDRKPEA